MKNKTIGIICAMDIELLGFKEKLTNLTTKTFLDHEFYVGDYLENTLVITKCGIGKVNASAICLLLIENFHPDLLFNSGIAGGYGKELKTLDVVVAEQLVYSDFDMTSDAFSNLRYGQIEHFPLTFKTDKEIVEKIKTLTNNENICFGTIATGDQFVTNYEKVDDIVTNYFSDLNVLAFDMESCAIAHVCYLTKTKVLVIRSISDLIGSSDAFDYGTFAPIAAKNATDLVNFIIKEL